MASGQNSLLLAAAASFMVAVAVCSYTVGANHAASQYSAVQVRTTPVTALRMTGGATIPEIQSRTISVARMAGIAEEGALMAEPKPKDQYTLAGMFGLGSIIAAAAFYFWNRSAPQPQVQEISLVGQEWSAAAIALEEDYPGPGSPDEEYTVTCVWEGQEHVLKIKGNTSILVACEEAGLEVPYLCRNGVCLDCTAKVVEGLEHARKDSQCHNSENVRNGYVCTCSTYVGGNGMKVLMGMQEEAYKAQFGKFEEEEREREKKKKNPFGL